ncbi:coagulation factor XI-like [Stigmatopora nigra]
MEVYFILLSLLTLISLSSQECKRELLQDVDFPGSDIKFEYSPDAQHCQLLCTQFPTCHFFTFIRPDWTEDQRHFYCYLKYAYWGEPNSQVPLLGVTSGYSLKPCSPDPQPCLDSVYQNVDFHGADYRTLFTADHQECQRICSKDPFCQFFTFIQPKFTSEKYRYKCHLKFSWTLPRTLNVNRKNGMISGFSQSGQFSQPSDTGKVPVCSTQLFPNAEIVGEAFTTQSTGTPEQCLAMCSAHPQCTFFSFQSSDFKCLLKENRNEMNLMAKNGVTSGISTHYCQQDTKWTTIPLEGIDFYGSDIRYVMMDDAEMCQNTCTDNHLCQFYTYINPNFEDPAGRRQCYLKRINIMPAPPKVSKLANVISGFSMRNCI